MCPLWEQLQEVLARSRSGAPPAGRSEQSICVRRRRRRRRRGMLLFSSALWRSGARTDGSSSSTRSPAEQNVQVGGADTRWTLRWTLRCTKSSFMDFHSCRAETCSCLGSRTPPCSGNKTSTSNELLWRKAAETRVRFLTDELVCSVLVIIIGNWLGQ